MRQCVLGLLAIVSIAVTVVAQGPTRTKVMLLDGESGGPYHKWQLTTPPDQEGARGDRPLRRHGRDRPGGDGGAG